MHRLRTSHSISSSRIRLFPSFISRHSRSGSVRSLPPQGKRQVRVHVLGATCHGKRRYTFAAPCRGLEAKGVGRSSSRSRPGPVHNTSPGSHRRVRPVGLRSVRGGRPRPITACTGGRYGRVKVMCVTPLEVVTDSAWKRCSSPSSPSHRRSPRPRTIGTTAMCR